MNVVPTDIPGVVVIEPRIHRDARGFVLETYRAEDYAQAGITTRFVQDTLTRSMPGTLRGLHYQLARPQAKLVRTVRGAVWDVAVDVRRGSPSYGRWTAVELTSENARQVFIPAGLAHGYCVVSPEGADVLYKSSDYYAPNDQHGIAWNDATLAIPWPVREPLLSSADRALLPLSADRGDLPAYRDASS